MNNNLGVERGILSNPDVRFLDLDSSVHQPSMNRIDDDRSLGFTETNIVNPNKSFSMNFGEGKAAAPMNDHNISEEDEPSFMEDDNGGRKVSSPWQRMKWTDSRVRLLIQVVASVGDDESLDNTNFGLNKRFGCLQKKGKWKKVSMMMITKNCQVSPQQCEDKFSDLNKRYKRLNDGLGRGTSCRVVEDPSLMDAMPLSAKTKDDIKKILNSKHLFYPEMCAYHNNQQIPNCVDFDLSKVRDLPINHDEDDYDESDDDDDVDFDHENSEKVKKLEEKNGFRDEMNEFFQDSNNTKLQKEMWVVKKMVELQEERVGIEGEAFTIEKKRFMWQRFCDKKDRELEVSKLENERLTLENERMILRLKHDEQVLEFE